MTNIHTKEEKKHWDDYEIQNPDGSWTTVSKLIALVERETRNETIKEVCDKTKFNTRCESCDTNSSIIMEMLKEARE